MKKIALYTLILLTSLNFIGCKESEYDGLYRDPSKTTEPTIEKLMSGTFYSSLTYVKPTYYRYYTMNVMKMSRYTQLIGVSNGDGMYEPSDRYGGDRWKAFYYSLTQLRQIENLYDQMDDAGKANYEVFPLVTKVFIYGQLQEIIDLFGDVPYSQAGMLPITGNIATAYAPYEGAETLYKMMMDDLKAINSRLAQLDGNLGSIASAYLPAQDFINKGSVLKWRKYANSLRLRMAMRVASQGALSAEGRAALKEMLENPSEYPVIDNNDENIQIDPDTNEFNPLKDESGSNGITEAFESGSATGATNRASKTVLDRMLPDDPRVPVLFEPNAEGEYLGLNPLDTREAQLIGLERNPNIYAAIDTATVSRNNNLPGVLFTAAEVSFIKAEAYYEGYARSQGEAQAAFEQAVQQSIDFYYRLNAASTYAEPVARPDDATIAAFARSKWTGDYRNAIATQKWIHFGPLYTQEAWSDMRRTGLPALEYYRDNSSVDSPTPVDRFGYPSDEKDNNRQNYLQVQDKDTYYTKLFWAK